MAIIQVNYMSQALWRTVPIQVILPVDKWTADKQLAERKPFKTLYLLHGLLGNYTDWVSGTRIQRWAEERDLAVVMPSGDNAFYVDHPETNNRYGEFVGKELVEITRRMFPLSDKREDTFIGGLSMGGFGAMRNGLKYHDTFSHIISLSGAFNTFEDVERLGEKTTADELYRFKMKLMEPIAERVLTEDNPRVLINHLAAQKAKDPNLSLPNIYLACGTEDELLKYNRVYDGLLRENGFDVTYEEGPGVHNWEFWDTCIKKAIDWLPLGSCSRGLGSGNIRAEQGE